MRMFVTDWLSERVSSRIGPDDIARIWFSHILGVELVLFHCHWILGFNFFSLFWSGEDGVWGGAMSEQFTCDLHTRKLLLSNISCKLSSYCQTTAKNLLKRHLTQHRQWINGVMSQCLIWHVIHPPTGTYFSEKSSFFFLNSSPLIPTAY